jgi:hypothetical protein
MVVVGRPWYKINRRILELNEFSAGRYSIGIGLPALKTNRSLLLKLSFVTLDSPVPQKAKC